jgi:hypothetical protein
VPFADLRAVDLQWTTDALVSQQRALPGQLRPLLDLMGVGAVVQGTDDDRSRSGAVPSSSAARVLRALGPPARGYGRPRTVPGAAGTLEPAARLAQVRRWSVPTGGTVRVLPRDGATVVDGSAAAIADLAAFGALRTDRALHYAADLDEAALRAEAARGASFVISDSNRRRVFVAARLRGNTGWTVPAGEKLSEDSAQLDPFPRRGTDAQTVALLGGGVASVHADFSPGFAQFPERRPSAALDGDPATAWLADRALATDRHHLDVSFTGPRDVDHVDLMPYSDGQGRVDRVAVNGREFAVHDGWNRLPLGLRGVRTLSVRIAHVVQPPTGEGGAGGIRELRIPGVRATEALRPPLLVEHALHGADLRRADLTYLFDRTTGDDPLRPNVVTGARSRGLVRDQQDGERGWTRAIAPPAARAWRADAWVSAAPETPDHVLDAWVGGGATAFDGSSRFEGLGRNRASSAFDGDSRRAWIAGWIGSRGAWLQWRTPVPRTLRTLRLERAPVRLRFPTRVRVVADGRPTAPLAVAADGSVALPAPLRARTVRIEVLDAAFPRGTPGIDRQRRAVGVGEVSGDGVPRAVVRHGGGALGLPCGDGPTLHLGAHVVRLRVGATAEAIDVGRPLHAVGCGAPVALPAAPVTIRADAAPWRLDHVRLTSPAAVRARVTGGGRVIDPGRDGRGTRDGVRVAVNGPSWLVLGESYDAGWHARCDGRSLGKPVALQGYANAWPVRRGCRDVSFAFAPNRSLLASDGISLVACLALLALLLLRRPRVAVAPLTALPDTPARAWPLPRALAAGAAAGLVLGFVFALRAGAVLAPLTFLVLWRGVAARTLALLAGGALLVIVPILHLAVGLPSEGYDTNYAVQRVAEHWVAVGAVCALAGSVGLTLSPARARRRRLDS